MMKCFKKYFDKSYWTRKKMALWAMLISGVFVLIEGIMDKQDANVITVEPEPADDNSGKTDGDDR